MVLQKNESFDFRHGTKHRFGSNREEDDVVSEGGGTYHLNRSRGLSCQNCF
jgi:hypothetical protein